jgi:hypothetical protein
MGYDSYVSGYAGGRNLVQQLLDQGFRQDGERVDAPDGSFTGVVVVDDDNLKGYEYDWSACYGFGDLIQALHRVQGLASVDLYREGDESGDVAGYRYQDGIWYTMIIIRRFVHEEETQKAEQAVESALLPFTPPDGGAK